MRLPVQPPWYADGLRFACTQCGNCCSGAPGYVWVTPEEIEHIATFLGQPAQQFSRKHLRRVGTGLSLRELRGGDCEFLERHRDGKTSCRIHTVRPTQCRTWPFWKSNLESPEEWAATGEGCPGLGRGPTHDLLTIERALAENGDLRL